MSNFQTVAQVGDVPDGEGRMYQVDGHLIALFLIDGEYHAINDLCPHMGASLSSGRIEGDTVMCPWHAWRFCVKDGSWVDNPTSNLKTDSYDVRVVKRDIQIRIPPVQSPAEP